MLHCDTKPFFVNYRDTLRATVMTEIVQPLCRDIETDLRLHIHTKHLGNELLKSLSCVIVFPYFVLSFNFLLLCFHWACLMVCQ